MKPLIVSIFLINPVLSFAQMNLGDPLDKIKQEDSSGVLVPNKDGFCYIVEDTSIQTKYIYFLDNNLICHTSVACPKKEVVENWRHQLNINKDWKHDKKDSTIWKMKRGRNIVSTCLETLDDEMNTLFVFTLVPIDAKR